MTDRATLDQIAETLAEVDQFLSRQYSLWEVNQDPTLYQVRKAWHAIWRCQGLVQQLRMPTTPVVVPDSVDEANADSSGTWD